MKTSKILPIVVLLILVLANLACGAGPIRFGPTETPTATPTPLPTSTPTVTPTPIPTPTPVPVEGIDTYMVWEDFEFKVVDAYYTSSYMWLGNEVTPDPGYQLLVVTLETPDDQEKIGEALNSQTCTETTCFCHLTTSDGFFGYGLWDRQVRGDSSEYHFVFAPTLNAREPVFHLGKTKVSLQEFLGKYGKLG